jgi:RND family efflux transporter MFP subunit
MMTRRAWLFRCPVAGVTGRGMALFLTALLLSGCGTSPTGGQDKKPVKVVATTPTPAEVIDYQDFTGRLDGLRNVEIRAHATGFIVSAPFKEGDLVHEGDLLFQIDPRPYEATLNQAEANLKLAEADLKLQERNVARARRLLSTSGIAQEEYETTVAALEKARANVGAMRAARDMAKLNLDYTRVTAPLTGRVSRRFVDPGNLVVQDSTLLTTVVNDEQLYAYFDVDERTYLDLRGSGSPGQESMLAGQKLPVLMRLANEETFTRAGEVNFVDNRVNGNTGTVRLRGVFDNPSGALKPGLFVRIRLPLHGSYEALLLADEALQSDQGRKFVYVVSEQGEVAYRPVAVGQELQGLRVIKDGLKKGDRVVVSGTQRARPGERVEVELQEPAKAPASELVRLVASFSAHANTEKKGGADRVGEAHGGGR